MPGLLVPGVLVPSLLVPPEVVFSSLENVMEQSYDALL
jgi:hypothetical protein